MLSLNPGGEKKSSMPLSTARGTRHFRTKEDQTKTSSFNLKCLFGFLRKLPSRKTDGSRKEKYPGRWVLV